MSVTKSVVAKTAGSLAEHGVSVIGGGHVAGKVAGAAVETVVEHAPGLAASIGANLAAGGLLTYTGLAFLIGTGGLGAFLGAGALAATVAIATGDSE